MVSRGSSTSHCSTPCCTSCSRWPLIKRSRSSSTWVTATPTPTSCSATRCTCVPCSGNRTTAPYPWCCCTSAIRTRGREATSPPSTRTYTSISPTAYPSSATARCSPLPGRRSASPLPPSSCTVLTALRCPSCTG